MRIRTEFSREALVLMLKALCAYRDWHAEHYDELSELIAVITVDLAYGVTPPLNQEHGDEHNEM